MEASNRPVASPLLHSTYAVQDGGQPVSPPCSAEGRLDDFHQSQGCISSGFDTSRQPSLTPVCCGWPGLSVKDPPLDTFHVHIV